MGWGKETGWSLLRFRVLGGAAGGQLEGLHEFLEEFIRWSELDTCLHDGARSCGGKAGADLETALLVIPRDHKSWE